MFQCFIAFDQFRPAGQIGRPAFLHGVQMRLLNLRIKGRDQTLDQLFGQLLTLGGWQSQRLIENLAGIRSHASQGIPKP